MRRVGGAHLGQHPRTISLGEGAIGVLLSRPVIATDYETLKNKILVRCSLSPANTAATFHKLSYHLGVTLLHNAQRLLQPGRHTTSQVIERVDQFLQALLSEEH